MSIALTSTAVVEKSSAPGPIRFDLISGLGPTVYPAGGIAAFQAAVRALLAVGDIEIIAVIGQECGGYHPVYDKANDKLKIWYSNSDAADGPMIENATADLSGVTFNLLVISK